MFVAIGKLMVVYVYLVSSERYDDLRKYIFSWAGCWT